MTVTQVSDYVYQSVGPWIVAVLISLVLAGILAFMIFNPATNEHGYSKLDVVIGSSFVAVAFFPTLFFVMAFIQMMTPMTSLYEGKVDSVSEPTQVSHYPVIITTMEGLDTPMYVINREGENTVEKVKVSDNPTAFLCEPRSMGRSNPTLLMCDILEDKPGSDAIERLKAEGLPS